MNWRAIGPLLAIALPPLIACSLVAVPRDPEAQAEILSAEGYARVVNDVFVFNDYLVSGSGPDEAVVRFGPAWDHLDKDSHEGRVLQRFARESALNSDVAGNDPDLWRIDGGLAGLAPGAHARVSPFARGRWRGSLHMVGSTHRATLTWTGSDSGASSVGLVGGDVTQTRDGEAEILRVPVFQPQTAYRDATVVDLTASAGDAHYLARVMMLGTTALVVAGRQPDVVRIDGSRLALRPGEGARLLSGSTLTLRAPGSDTTATLRLDSGAAAFSVAGALGGRRRHPDYEAFAEQFDNAMDIAVMACERRRGDCSALARLPVTLTLDVDLEREIRRDLRATLGDSLYPAAVTVMNALNGEVLAAVGHDPASAWGTGDLFENRSRPINHAFEPLTIGSAAKPPVAAAILSHQAHRNGRTGGARLIDLRIRNTATLEHCDEETASYTRQILGVPLGNDCDAWIRTAGGGDWIDLTRFFEVSSNQYAASLMILGSAIDLDDLEGQPASGWRIGDDDLERARLPRLQEGVVLDSGGPRFGSLSNPPNWSPAFTDLFPAGNRDSGAGLADLGVWRRVIGAVSDRDRDRMAPLSAISPAVLDFDFEELDVRRQYFPVILGGQAYRWSTLRLAESYARLVTGDDVRARLITGGRLAGRLNAYPDSVQAEICQGLSAVMEGANGTGRYDSGPMGVVRRWRTRSDDSIVVYGKTGTPEIEAYTEAQMRYVRDQDGLLARGFIIYRDGRMVIPDGAGGYLAPIDGESATRVARRLEAQPGVGDQLGGAAIRAAVERMRDFNNAPRQDWGSYYLFRDGRPRAIASPDPEGRMFGHVIVFVVAVYAGDAPQTCVDAQPLRAFTVAVNIQDERYSALALAHRVLGHMERQVLGEEPFS